jgi:hypothetical protein
MPSSSRLSDESVNMPPLFRASPVRIRTFQLADPQRHHASVVVPVDFQPLALHGSPTGTRIPAQGCGSLATNALGCSAPDPCPEGALESSHPLLLRLANPFPRAPSGPMDFLTHHPGHRSPKSLSQGCPDSRLPVSLQVSARDLYGLGTTGSPGILRASTAAVCR